MSYLYEDVIDCLAWGDHGHDADDDGFCNECGYPPVVEDEDLDPSEEDL